jgi:hypothetical protein
MPKRDARLVTVYVRMFGHTRRRDIDLDAFVGVVIEAGRKHLGVKDLVRVESGAPQAPTMTPNQG